MRQQIVILACLCSALVYALPISETNNKDGLQLVQIPLENNKELDILSIEEDGTLSERSKRTIGILRELFPELTKLNSDGSSAIDLNALNAQLQRVARQTVSENSVTNDSAGDQDGSESKSPAIDELTLDAEEDDADDRNKRFLNFGFGAQAQGSAGGGGGVAAAGGAGSGNFLFDIIRRTADRAARAAGTVYRVVAGTETLDLNETGSQKSMTTTTTTTKTQQGQLSKLIDRTARTINDGLFSGSVQTPQGDERANEPAQANDDQQQQQGGGGGGAAAAGDGYTEGIPGPVTRLVVLANRGLANLIQDLILRIAATSERLVNFKARLITSLI